MKTTSYRILFAFLALVPASTLAAEALLIYERVHQQVAHEDNAVRLVVFDDDRVEAHFPFYSPNAGTHEWQITSEERSALIRLTDPLLEIDTQGLHHEIDAHRSQRQTLVTDADQVTIEVINSTQNSTRVTAPSPEIWASNLPDTSAMASMATVAEGLSDWMLDNVEKHQP